MLKVNDGTVIEGIFDDDKYIDLIYLIDLLTYIAYFIYSFRTPLRFG